MLGERAEITRSIKRHEITPVDNTLTRIGKPPVDRIFGARRASASAPAVTLAISAYAEQPQLSARAVTKKNNGQKNVDVSIPLQ